MSTMSEEHKKKLADGRKRWQEQQKAEKERLKAEAEAQAAEKGPEVLRNGVLKRNIKEKAENFEVMGDVTETLAKVIPINGEMLDERTLDLIEANLVASKALLSASLAYITALRAQKAKQKAE